MFKKNYIIKGEIVCKTGLHIGGSNDNIDIGGTDTVVIRDSVTDLPFIPGSSLKGKLRSLLELNDKDLLRVLLIIKVNLLQMLIVLQHKSLAYLRIKEKV